MTAAFRLCLLLLLAPLAAQAQLTVDAGDDVVLECEGKDGAEYTLNGTIEGAEDVSFEWTTDPAVSLEDDMTLTPTGVFPEGETEVTLFAEDNASDDSAGDTVTITVEDTKPPVVEAWASPRELWPPNHKMVPIEVRFRLRDRCGDEDDLDVELISARSNEPDNGKGDGNFPNDIQMADIGSDDRHVKLRAERAGPGNGRVYTLRYRVTDRAGNETIAEARVYVPHDRGGSDDPDDGDDHDDMDGDDDMGPICPAPDDAAQEFVAGTPDIDLYRNERACQRACSVWERGCRGIVAGSGRCVRSEVRARLLLGRVECNEFRGDDRRECRERLREFTERALERLEERSEDGEAICERTVDRCDRACERVHGEE